MLGAENVIMEMRNPLLTRSGRVKVGYCCTYLLEYTIPEKSWILVGQVSGLHISKLPIHSYFLELVIQCVCLSGIKGIAQLPDQVGRLHQTRL